MIRLVSASFGLAFSGLIVSAAVAEVTRESVREVLQRAGVVERIINETVDLHYRIAKGAAQESEGLPAEFSDRMLALLLSVADAETLVERAVRKLSERLSEEERDQVDAFYASPLGRRIVALEGAVSTTEAIDRIHDQQAKVNARLKDDPVRKMLLGWLDDALYTSERAASLAAGLEVGGDRGFALAQRQELVRTFEEDFEAAKASSIWEQRRESMLRSEYTYGPLTDSEILSYLRFLHAPAGKRFHHLLEVVTTAAIMEGGESLAVALAALLNEAPN